VVDFDALVEAVDQSPVVIVSGPSVMVTDSAREESWHRAGGFDDHPPTGDGCSRDRSAASTHPTPPCT
jgi:hypothetical protein